MIAVGTPALMAITLNEAEADGYAATLADADRLLICASTLAEESGYALLFLGEDFARTDVVHVKRNASPLP